jgi:RNA polymerase sigma-70 factor (ECF subfamily)
VSRASRPQAEPVAEADFATLYEREFSYVWRTLQRLGIPWRDLEDAAHDVLVVAYRRRGDYDSARPLRPWLFGIALRVVYEYRRKARPADEPLLDRDGPPDLARGPEERVADGQGRRLVIDLLGKLDTDRRAVLILHDLDGEPMPRIAEALGLPLNTAYSRLRLARADLAAEFRRLRARSGEQ